MNLNKLIVLILILALSTPGICQNPFVNDLKLLVEATSPEDGAFSPNDKPPQFLVYGVWTMGVAWQKDTIDNFEHKLFRNIVDSYSTTELLLMTTHEYPNIRAYGYWGLLILDDKKTSKEVYKRLSNDDARFLFIGFSDRYDEYSVAKFCKELKRGKIKHEYHAL